MGLGSFFKRNKDNKEEIVESHINIDNVMCKGFDCQKCVIACPNNVLMMKNSEILVVNHLICKHCKVCEAICPNDCITVN